MGYLNLALNNPAQVFFSLEFVNILLQMEAKAVKNASSLLHFSGPRELGSGLLFWFKFDQNKPRNNAFWLWRAKRNLFWRWKENFLKSKISHAFGQRMPISWFIVIKDVNIIVGLFRFGQNKTRRNNAWWLAREKRHLFDYNKTECLKAQKMAFSQKVNSCFW